MKGEDPRITMSSEALAAANDMAMPKVAIRGGDSGTAIAAVIAIGLGLFAFVQMSTARLKRVDTEPQPIVITAAPVAPAPTPAPAPAYSTPPASPRIIDEEPRVRPERLRAPSLVFDAGPSGAEQATGHAAIANGGALTASEQFAARVSDTDNRPATATHIGDLGATVIEGTLIAGVLETAVNSDLPGFTRAIVSDDVRSFDGTEILIPRGSRLIGQYRSGLAIGESRAFVVWTRLILPSGVAIYLASPVTDPLGRAGLGGKVDRHFLQRFGSAILLSIIGAGAEIAAAESGSNQVVITSSAQAYGVAQTALQSSVNIPPTIRIPQGAPIRIFVARDLIFPLYEESGGVALTAEEP